MPSVSSDDESARRLLEKIRAFVARELDGGERQLFAALLAPGVAQATEASEVAGFTTMEWPADAFPEALGRALRESGIRVTGLDS